MNRSRKEQKRKLVSLKITTGFFLLLLLSLSIVGATSAWFLSGDSSSNMFTAGTIILEKPGEPVYGETIVTGQGEKCTTGTWSIKSLGTKRAYVRIKPLAQVKEYRDIYIAIKTTVGGETAWAEGSPIPGRDGGSEWHYQYFTYSLGKYNSEINSLQVMLISNKKYVGYVLVWDDGEKIYIKFVAYTQYGGFKDIHVYAGLTLVPGNVGHAKYPFKYNDLNDLAEFMLVLDSIYHSYDGPTILVKDIEQPDPYIITPELCENSSGTGSWVPGTDGWYYYGTIDGGPTIVNNGNSVSACFKYCYPETAQGSLAVSLEAEAIQVTNNAINEIWTTNPWFTQ